jgi:hypothetical protein
MRRFAKRAGIAIAVILVVLQFVPLTRANPPVTREIKWNAPETRVLTQRACFDCHSNQTVWPWYAYVAPLSMRVVNHVDEGRQRLNFSQWDQPNADFNEVKRSLTEGQMPLSDYLLLHGNAKLSAAETTALLAGLAATFQQDPPIPQPRRQRP